ncbi:MAG: aromatic amino acid transport family protein [Coxiellaceae bacterium]|nr:aromatic amino acid transport family protein [Coxiellaceae bacterium]
MTIREIGSILLILGTCIGGGMLALPIVTAEQSYWLSIVMVCFTWIVMTAGSFALLKVNLDMAPGSNLVSMSRHTLGRSAAILTWGAYLLLLYSLICAFLAAGGDIVQALLHKVDVTIPRWSATLITVVVLGGIVYRGIYSVDLVNRLLMLAKITICIILLATIIPHGHQQLLFNGDFKFHGNALLVVICSFGYAIILPSIRVYLNSDKKRLYRTVLIGSLIPMVLYLIWIGAIQATVARAGATGLVAMNASANTTSLLMRHLVDITHNPIVQSLGVAFVSICAITAFLGVSVSLMDFLTDGLKLKKQGKGGAVIALATYLPPVLIVLMAPSIFTSALAYAGIFCIYILILLPIAMWWFSRKKA